MVQFVKHSGIHCSLTFSLVISLKAESNWASRVFDFLEKPRPTIELTSYIKGQYIICKDLTVYWQWVPRGQPMGLLMQM